MCNELFSFLELLVHPCHEDCCNFIASSLLVGLNLLGKLDMMGSYKDTVTLALSFDINMKEYCHMVTKIPWGGIEDGTGGEKMHFKALDYSMIGNLDILAWLSSCINMYH